MKQELSINPSTITITTDGAGYISQRSVDRLMGMKAGSVSQLIKTKAFRAKTSHLNLNENNQLDEKTFKNIALHYAQKGNSYALNLIGSMLDAGVRVFLHGLAGKPLPQESVHALDGSSNAVHRAQTKNLARGIRNSHTTLQELVGQRILRCTKVPYVKYVYEVTMHGEILGYTQNENGTVIPPL